MLSLSSQSRIFIHALPTDIVPMNNILRRRRPFCTRGKSPTIPHGYSGLQYLKLFELPAGAFRERLVGAN